MKDTAQAQSEADQSAELLRMALPLMAKHKVPVTPANYTVWYHYLQKDNAALNAELDRLIESATEFTGELNRKLYRQFVGEMDTDQMDQVRDDMAAIMGEIQRSLADAGNDAASYGGTLEGMANNMSSNSDPSQIKSLVAELVEETRAMQRSTQSLQDHLDAKSSEIDKLKEELEAERKRASSDPLTGLANRFAMFDNLSEMIAEADEMNTPLSLLMLDIDHFKRVNDTQGHLIGDRVIRFVSQVLQQNTKGRDLAARYGGEEFAVLLPDTALEGAGILAERIRAKVAEAKLVRSDNKKPLGQITISLGVSLFRKGEDEMEFINRADQALYAAKHGGRNQVVNERALEAKKTA